MNELSMVVMVAVPCAAAVAWVVTLHARVRTHSEELLEVKSDIRYIRERIDRAVTAQSHR
jgi:hypothetical protein